MRTRVSHNEFSYSYLSLLSVNCYSFVRIIATLVLINLQRTLQLKVMPLGAERFIPSNSISSGGKKGSQHLPRSSVWHSRLLLSTRPCVSRAVAFVVVVIVSSRVMGRFQAARRRPGVGSDVKRQPRKRRHVGALTFDQEAPRIVTVDRRRGDKVGTIARR